MSALRLLWVFFRINLLNELAYRANFFFQLIQSLTGLATALAALAVVFSHTDTLAGWRRDELLALVGVFFLVGGIINLVIQPSMQQFMVDVQQGTLDFTLTKPADAQLLVSVQQMRIWQMVDVLLGLGVVAIALARLHETLGVDRVAAFAVALAAGGAIVYSFWLILATCSFWFIRVNNLLYIFESLYEAGRWPVAIYPRWLRLTLTFIVPVAFAVTVPSQALIGRLTLAGLAGALGLAAALLALSRWFWKQGIRHYSGASA